MIKLLHFADAHIDIARQGRHDPHSGLPLRVMDFLRALDVIMDTAISEQVDLVIFAGDAYRDRTPVPTFQREWGKRMLRLSKAKILTLLVVGNHDLSPAVGRAHALQEYETLQVPHIRVIRQPCFLKPSDLNGLSLQVIGIPWVTRSSLMANSPLSGLNVAQIGQEIEKGVSQMLEGWLEQLDPQLPAVLTSHVSVQGAVYGNERSVMLGKDLVLGASLVKDKRLDYVALGHIHKYQNLNAGQHPPVVYPGSIERVDFGEINDRKRFVIAEIEKGKTNLRMFDLPGRKFIDRAVSIQNAENAMQQVLDALPPPEELQDAILRLSISYPRAWEAHIDESALRAYAQHAFEFHLLRRPQMESRLRLPDDQSVNRMAPLELLDLYWKSLNTDREESQALNRLAGEIIRAVKMGQEEQLNLSEGDGPA